MERTLAAASRFAQAAFADADAGQHVEALAHAGIALELLAKAALIHTHPLLVIDAPGGKMNLAGMEAALKGGGFIADGTRTINADEALRRCGQLVKGFEPRSYAELIGVRNGSVHIGHGEVERVAQSLVSLVDAARRLLPGLPIDDGDFWGPFAGSATSASLLTSTRSASASPTGSRQRLPAGRRLWAPWTSCNSGRSDRPSPA